MDPKKEYAFFSNSNNGTVAIVPAEVYAEMNHREQIAQEAAKNGKAVVNMPPALPIFTFSDNPSLKPYVTGTLSAMRVLLAGYSVGDGNIWVPFSNQKQWCGDREQERAELLFVTYLDDILKYFSKTLVIVENK